MKKSQDITVGYRVEKADKEVTFRFSELPRDLIDEVSSVTNKIARFAEENPKLNKQE